MPKKLGIHPNERIDIPDFTRAANEFTADTAAFNANNRVLDDRARLLEGFRVAVEDQTASPGRITVHNGHALRRDGQHINNEDAPNFSQSITLVGGGNTFFVEIEFAESKSDTDSRVFWDPTVENPVPIPDGQEFSTNVTTRVTPTWRIVEPVSTTGFDADTDPSSSKIPLLKIETSPGNVIDTLAGRNPGLNQVVASTVAEYDVVATTQKKIPVLDARLIPDSGNIIFDPSGVNESAAIATVDRVNNIVTIGAGLANSFNAGTQVSVDAPVATFVEQRIAAVPDLPSATDTHPDRGRRLWQGDEIRGSAVSSSKETPGSRDDLNIRTLKDQIDFLSSQLREMKFGNLRSGVTSTAPPNDFADTRYWGNAGSITGARNASVSVGTGSATYGDFNGTDDVPLQEAIDAAPNGGTVYVKDGTYTLTTALTINNKGLIIEGDRGAKIQINSGSEPCFDIDGDAEVVFKNIQLEQDGNERNVINSEANILELHGCKVNGYINYDGGNNVDRLILSHCRFESINKDGTVFNLSGGAPRYLQISVTNCHFDLNDADLDFFSMSECELFTFQNNYVNMNSGRFWTAINGPYEQVSIRDNWFDMEGGRFLRAAGNQKFDNLVIDGLFVQYAGDMATQDWIELERVASTTIRNVHISGTLANTVGHSRFVKIGDDTLTPASDEKPKLIMDNVTVRFNEADGGSLLRAGDGGSQNPVPYDITVRDCHAHRFQDAIVHYLPGTLKVENCIFDGEADGSAQTRYGVRAGCSGDNLTLDVTIINNVFKDMRGKNPSDTAAIYLDDNGETLVNAITNAVITGNRISNIGNDAGDSNNGIGAGVRVDSSITYEYIRIDHNIIHAIEAIAGFAIPAGIYFQGKPKLESDPTDTKLSIQNNHIYDISSLAVSNIAHGILIQPGTGSLGDSPLHNCTIAHNSITSVISQSGANRAIFIGSAGTVGEVQGLSIVHNHIADIVSDPTNNTAGKFVEVFAGQMQRIDISHNNLESDSGFAGGPGSLGGEAGILLNFATDGLPGKYIRIIGNAMKCGIGTRSGIKIKGPFTGGSGVTITGTTITNNTIEISQTLNDDIITAAIWVGSINSNGMTIANNTIDELGYNQRRAGIYVDSGAQVSGYDIKDTCITGNAIRLADEVNNVRLIAGIELGQLLHFTVTGNSIASPSTGAGLFVGITVNSSITGTITGNIISPSVGNILFNLNIIGIVSNQEIFATGNYGQCPGNDISNDVIVNSQTAGNIQGWLNADSENGAFNLRT